MIFHLPHAPHSMVNSTRSGQLLSEGQIAW